MSSFDAKPEGPIDGPSWLGDVALGSMPAVTAFMIIPVELYLANQGELNYNTIVLAPYAVLWALWVGGLAAGRCLVRGRWRERVVRGLFWFGLFLFLSDIVAPVQLGPLDGSQMRPAEPLQLTIREGVLAGLIAVAGAKIPARQARLFGIGFVALLTVLQPLRLFWESSASASSGQIKRHPAAEEPASSPNVYHVTFDAYHSGLFEEAAVRTGRREEFDGFVFFKKNRSNYCWTGLSMASYMTGTFYEGGSLRHWMLAAFDSGITEELFRHHFVVWNYAHSRPYVHRRAAYVRTNVELMAERGLVSLASSFADVWLVRVVPNPLQNEVYYEGKGVFSRLVEAGSDVWAGPPAAVAEQEARAFYSVALARRLIEEERIRPARGQYVYAHIYLPHPKYIMDEHCNYTPGRADVRSQTLCATRLMADFIGELKRLGRYDESTIIFQSDHTWDFAVEVEPHSRMGAERLRENVWRADPAVIDNLTRALLLIKPSGRAGMPLATSDRAAQLVDVPATLYAMVGIVPSVEPPQGQSLMAQDFPNDREAHIFLGYRQTDEKGRFRFVGRDFKEGHLNHFSYSVSEGWRRYANRPVRW